MAQGCRLSPTPTLSPTQGSSSVRQAICSSQSQKHLLEIAPSRRCWRRPCHAKSEQSTEASVTWAIYATFAHLCIDRR